MKVVIDTSSLLALIRYYLPFDTGNVITDFIKQKISDGNLIVIDKVYDECKYLSGGIILKELSFLQDKTFKKVSKLPYDTSILFPIKPKRFDNMMSEQFVVQSQKRRISLVEFENQKEIFYNSPDIKQVIVCQNLISNGHHDVILVTEETTISNDNKLFKKIPAICEFLEINTIALPDLIKKYGVEVRFHTNNKF